MYEPYTPSYSDPASDSSQQQDTAGAVIEQGYGDPSAGEVGLGQWQSQGVATAPPISAEEVPQSQPSRPSPSGDLGLPSIDEVRTIDQNQVQTQLPLPDVGAKVGAIASGADGGVSVMPPISSPLTSEIFTNEQQDQLDVTKAVALTAGVIVTGVVIATTAPVIGSVAIAAGITFGVGFALSSFSTVLEQQDIVNNSACFDDSRNVSICSQLFQPNLTIIYLKFDVFVS